MRGGRWAVGNPESRLMILAIKARVGVERLSSWGRPVILASGQAQLVSWQNTGDYAPSANEIAAFSPELWLICGLVASASCSLQSRGTHPGTLYSVLGDKLPACSESRRALLLVVSANSIPHLGQNGRRATKKLWRSTPCPERKKPAKSTRSQVLPLSPMSNPLILRGWPLQE